MKRTVLLAVLLAACGREKVTELSLPVMAPGAEFALVEIKRRHGISIGHEYFVTCRSWTTAARARGQPEYFVPRGSVLVGPIDISETETPQGSDLANARYLAVRSIEAGDGWIAWKHQGLRISLDQCASWADFAPRKAIPLSEVLYAGRPCENEDCSFNRFRRHTDFRDLNVERRTGLPSRISFTFRSDALANSNVRSVTSEDGGATWQVVPPRQASVGAWTPDIARYVAPREAEDARPIYALTDEELAKIAVPVSTTSAQRRAIDEIKLEAKKGYLWRVKSPPSQATGVEVDNFRQAVLEAMQAKPEQLAADSARRIAASAASHALSDAELAAIPIAGLPPGNLLAVRQIEAIKDAAKAGSTAYIKAVLPEGKAVDRFKRAVLTAMTDKAKRTYLEQLELQRTALRTPERRAIRP